MPAALNGGRKPYFFRVNRCSTFLRMFPAFFTATAGARRLRGLLRLLADFIPLSAGDLCPVLIHKRAASIDDVGPLRSKLALTAISIFHNNVRYGARSVIGIHIIRSREASSPLRN
jgi:hypothetical protein